MIYKPNQQAIDDYFASNIISQSKLKLLPKGISVFNDIKSDTDAEVMFYEEKSYFLIGQGAELKIQQGSQVFNNTYHLSEVSKPSDKILSMVQQIFDLQGRVKEPTDPFPLLCNVHADDIMAAITLHEYQANWKAETKIAKIITDGTAYYNDLIKSYGKQILDLDEATVINSITDSWKENPRTYMFFDHEYSEKNYIDYHYQFPIYFEYMGVQFKALLDILEVDHKNKTLRPLDLKTLGGTTISFPSSLRKLRYDFQGAFYCLATSQFKRQVLNFNNYRVLKPEFIVETTKLGQQGIPLIYELSDSLMDIALFGRKLYSSGEHYDDRNMLTRQDVQTSEIYGIHDTIELYKWHLENGFDTDRVVKEADSKNRRLLLNWEGIDV
jgi:hypothetical protein